MSRLGYVCDGCGKEFKSTSHRTAEPAAYVDGDEFCASCYDRWAKEQEP